MKSCINGHNLVRTENNIVKIINEKLFQEKNLKYNKSYPSARWKHAAVVYENYLYIMGGCGWITVLKDLWRLNLDVFCAANKDHVEIHEFWNRFNYHDENLWYDLSGFIGHIPPLQSHTMIAYNNQLYIFGGTFAYDIRDCPLWIYSLEFQIMRKWKDKDNNELPAPRRNHTCLFYRDTMLIFGGFGDVRGSFGDLWRFDLKYEKWNLIWSYQKNSKNIISAHNRIGPCPRHDHVSVIHHKSMFIYGGMSGLEECADLWQWYIDEEQWTKISFKIGPTNLRFISAIKIRGHWIIYGLNESKGKSEKWKYNFRMRKWNLDYSNLSNLPPHSTFSLSGNNTGKSLSIKNHDHLNLRSNKISPMPESHSDYMGSSDRLCMKSCSTINTLKTTFQPITPVDFIEHSYVYNNFDYADQLETTFTEFVEDNVVVGMSNVNEYILLLGNNIDKASFDNYICIQFCLL